jgi:hypothetical protein
MLLDFPVRACLAPMSALYTHTMVRVQKNVPYLFGMRFDPAMGNGKWSRWGRGSCEGWSLEIGWALRGQVVRRTDGRWKASLNATELETWKTRAEAMRVVEQRITREVKAIQEDWAIWQTALSASSRSGKTLLNHPDTGQTDTP